MRGDALPLLSHALCGVPGFMREVSARRIRFSGTDKHRGNLAQAMGDMEHAAIHITTWGGENAVAGAPGLDKEQVINGFTTHGKTQRCTKTIPLRRL